MARHQGLISRFTPSRTSPEVLEAIFVQRDHLLADTLERLRESIHGAGKHHFLFIGPRGSGKSHLVALIAHRLELELELNRQMCMAWLDEDETTTSYLDLLLRIHRALSQAYPHDFVDEAIDAVYDLPEVEAAQYMQRHVLQQLSGRVPVVLVENLDKLFDGLGEEGQKRWRAFMQEAGVFVTVATSQRLFDDIRARSAPFFGQFQVEHLVPLKLDDAVELLRRISLYYEDQDLAAFLRTNQGHSRVEAVFHLSGGNHRVFIILSEFISREALDELVMAFDKLLDELTPYYQQRIDWLPAQQRKIVEYLCRNEGSVPVKDMSRRLFMTQQTASRQLKELRDKGYVISHSRGRESLYELAEPLMRMCVEVKENRRQPVRLVVRFLRVWYTDDELRRIEKSPLGASYIEAALSERVESNLVDLESNQDSKGIGQTKPSEIRDHWIHSISNGLKDFMDNLSKIIESSADKEDISKALLNRGAGYVILGDLHQAILDYTKVIHILDVPAEYQERALLDRALVYEQQDDYKNAIEDLDKLVCLNPSEDFAWLFRVTILMNLSNWDEAFNALDYTLKSFPPSTTGEAGNTSEMIRIISQQSASKWRQLVTRMMAVHRDADALDFLATGLVMSLGTVEVPAESLDTWEQVWRDASGDLAAMRVPIRLFTVGIRYLKSVGPNGGDERILYDLHMEEASILRDALSLAAPVNP